jgi:hypothetical protein
MERESRALYECEDVAFGVLEPSGPRAVHGGDARLGLVAACARTRGWVTTYIADDRRRQLCIFEAVDAESVRRSFRTAGVAFERVWSAARLPP